MTAILFFVFCAVLLIGFVYAILNMGRMMHNFGITSIEAMEKRTINGMKHHILAILFMGIGSGGMLVTGIIWLVETLK